MFQTYESIIKKYPFLKYIIYSDAEFMHEKVSSFFF